MLPLLTIFAVIVSIIGGMWVANLYAHISNESFIASARSVLPFTDVLKGLLKDHLRLEDDVLAADIFPDSAGVRPMSGLVG